MQGERLSRGHSTPLVMDKSPSEDSTDWQTRSATRVTVLDALTTEPRDRAELQSLTDVSQAACNDLLEDSEERDWIRHNGAQYQVTPTGEIMAAHLTALLEFFESVSRDRPVIEDHSDRITSIETAIDEIEESSIIRDSQIAQLEQRLKQQAGSEDIDHLQGTVGSTSEQWQESQEEVEDLSRTLNEIDERLDHVEERQQTIQTALTEAKTRDEELRAELAKVREIAEHAANQANQGWVDRLSGG